MLYDYFPGRRKHMPESAPYDTCVVMHYDRAKVSKKMFHPRMKQTNRQKLFRGSFSIQRQELVRVIERKEESVGRAAYISAT